MPFNCTSFCVAVANFVDFPAGWNVDFVCVMNAWRCRTFANMRNKGLKDKEQAESR